MISAEVKVHKKISQLCPSYCSNRARTKGQNVVSNSFQAHADWHISKLAIKALSGHFFLFKN